MEYLVFGGENEEEKIENKIIIIIVILIARTYLPGFSIQKHYDAVFYFKIH